MKQKKFYVVWKGRETGIFESWAKAEAQVKGYAGAEFKAFGSRAEAEHALRAPYGAAVPPKRLPSHPRERWQPLRLLGVEPPVMPSYCADAACSGNPGVLEYRVVETETGRVILARGPFPEGTNNIGEFLGIVEALLWLDQRGDAAPVYSDSGIARGWVSDKECKTQLAPSPRNAGLFKRIARAEKWLRTHEYPNRILKWDTENWGENPADYGRK